MAYDANGNYYFDPNVDFEDQELMQDEIKREQVRQHVKTQQKAAKENQDIGNLWGETLKEEGIDAQTYQELYEQDPALAKNLMREGMSHLAKGIKRGRDSKTGRFTKAPAGQQRSPVGQRSSESTQRIDAIRQKAKTGNLSEQDEFDLIDDLFPGGL